MEAKIFCVVGLLFAIANHYTLLLSALVSIDEGRKGEFATDS